MIFDNDNMFFDGAAYSATSSIIDLGMAGAGAGRPINVHASAAGDAADITAIVLVDGTTSTPATALMTVATTATEMNDQGVTFTLPSSTSRYVQISALTAASAGTITAGIILDSGQTNK